jgi:hypothetical protein
MVLYSIPNLNKSFTIAHSIPEIKNGVALIPLLNNKYKATSFDDSFDSVTLETKEFLNSGVFVNFNLVPIQEKKTDVTLEIRRIKRSFNQNFQVTNNFMSIENLIVQLSEAIALSTKQIL